jgi:hypothetical protein
MRLSFNIWRSQLKKGSRVAKSGAVIQEPFNDFEAFKARYPSLYDLRLEFEDKDVGLHWSVAGAASDFIKDYTFPKGIENDNEKAMFFLGLVDDAGIGRRKIVNAARVRRNEDTASVFLNLLRDWRRTPQTVKARKRNAIEVLTVFHYLTHHVMDESGAPRSYYWARIMQDLVPEDVLRERRANYFDAKKQDPSKPAQNGPQDTVPENETRREPLRPIGTTEPPLSRLSTERIQHLRDRLIGPQGRKQLYYRLDYSNQGQAFQFDPETFRHSSDEEHLDDVLIELSIIGGMIDRGEATVLDLLPLQTVISVFVGSSEVGSYLEWLITPQELPNHCSFLGAVNLYEYLGEPIEGSLAKYRDNALRVIKDRLGKP